jgi:ankyrin repeat protein
MLVSCQHTSLVMWTRWVMRCKLACRYGQLNVVTWLVEHTVLRDDGEWLGRALVGACLYNHWNIVKWLVINTQVDVNYADIDRTDRTNNSILHCVISFNPTNLLLHSAILGDMTELCRLVYVCGEDVNVQDNYYGYTPLHMACYHDTSDSVGALLLAGADETITNDMGMDTCTIRCERDYVKVLPLLDVSSKWKLLVRSHRLRRRTAVRVMMTLVKWKVQQTRSMWTRAIMTLHTIITCTVLHA